MILDYVLLKERHQFVVLLKFISTLSSLKLIVCFFQGIGRIFFPRLSLCFLFDTFVMEEPNLILLPY